VGRGYFTEEAAQQCNREMLDQLGLGLDLFEAICLCPEAPDAAIEYRKPSPRFGLELMEKYGRTTNDICYIGDNVTDLLTARHIGCAGIGVSTGAHDLCGELAAQGLEMLFPVCESFLTAVEQLLADWDDAG
jgi:D-glycero-D-manno-heptose 1,7-bisphosphate phosphatase